MHKRLAAEKVQFEVQRAMKERQFTTLQKTLRVEREQFEEERSLIEVYLPSILSLFLSNSYVSKVIVTTLRNKLNEERAQAASLQKALEESQDELHRRIEEDNRKRSFCPPSCLFLIFSDLLFKIGR
jgi:hypothetical protein